MKLEYFGNAALVILYGTIAFMAATVLAFCVFVCGMLWLTMWQAVTS